MRELSSPLATVAAGVVLLPLVIDAVGWLVVCVDAGCSGAKANDLFAVGTFDASVAAGPPMPGVRDDASSSGGSGAAVACPPAGRCAVPSEVCCRGDAGDRCMAPGACANLPGLSITCDGPAACATGGHAGDLCCVTVDSRGNTTTVACQAPANCTGAQLSTPVCDRVDSGPCPSGLACQPSMTTLPGFLICR